MRTRQHEANIAPSEPPNIGRLVSGLRGCASGTMPLDRTSGAPDSRTGFKRQHAAGKTCLSRRASRVALQRTHTAAAAAIYEGLWAPSRSGRGPGSGGDSARHGDLAREESVYAPPPRDTTAPLGGKGDVETCDWGGGDCRDRAASLARFGRDWSRSPGWDLAQKPLRSREALRGPRRPPVEPSRWGQAAPTPGAAGLGR